jgi:hypothetical protein
MTEKKKKKMIYVLDIYQSRSLRIVPSPSTFEQISGKTIRVKFFRLWSEWWCKKKQNSKSKVRQGKWNQSYSVSLYFASEVKLL